MYSLAAKKNYSLIIYSFNYVNTAEAVSVDRLHFFRTNINVVAWGMAKMRFGN